MAIDIKKEDLLSMAEVCVWLEQRFKLSVNRTTLYRWATRGVRGVKLETLQVGNLSLIHI